jgi:SAM-dependent methyltransferase
VNRGVANAIRYLMDEWIPAAIRDSRWFMWPFFWLAYHGKNIRETMEFKSRVHAFTRADYARFNQPSLHFILEGITPQAASLVDVGCGNGYLLRRVRERHPRLALTGVDLLEHPPDAPDTAYVRADLERLPFADGAFDVVTCSHTVEHVLRLEACLRELVRIARMQVFIITPCQRPFYYTLDEHLNFFPYREALTAYVPLRTYRCEKLQGDWVYAGVVDRVVASG